MDENLDRLPRTYAEFLVLKGQGLEDTVIAERLGLPVEALILLARLANAKLARLHQEATERGAVLGDDPLAPHQQHHPGEDDARPI